MLFFTKIYDKKIESDFCLFFIFLNLILFLSFLSLFMSYHLYTTVLNLKLDSAKKDWQVVHASNPYARNKEKLPIHFTIYEDYPTFKEWDEAILQVIKTHPRQINAQDKNGDTAMHRLLYSGSSRCIEALLQAGIDLKLENLQGVSVWEEMLNIHEDRAHTGMYELFEAEALRRTQAGWKHTKVSATQD